MSALPRAQTNSTSHPNLLSTYRAVLDTFTSFLTVSIHHIIYLRGLYPPVSFLSARAYNYPVRQNRHPVVCSWIDDATAAIRDQLEKNTVERVALCIYECDSNRVLERWTFDLHAFPSVAKRDQDIQFESSEDTPDLSRPLNLADLEANFRATLSRISTSASRLKSLPEGPDAPECSFTVTIEVKDKAERPVGRLEEEERKWIAAEPEPVSAESNSLTEALGEQRIEKRNSRFPGEGRTHPIRRLEADELRLEMWVEESAAKFEYKTSSQPTAADRAAAMSYGAGTGTFDPGDAFELEPADVNRKPQGGAMSDYR